MNKRLVAGPPCGGKTTFVKVRALPHESVLDFDDIVERLTGDRYAEQAPKVLAEARRQWKAALPAADWVVWTAPRRVDRGRFRSQFNAQVYVVMAPLGVCLERAKRERPPPWEDLIRRWFADWEPSRSGQETIVNG